MYKKLYILLIIGALNFTSVYSATDAISVDYLKNKKHFAILNPLVECFAQKVIKNSLKKATGENFKVKFDGYTLHSMKAGVFKNLELESNDISINGIDVKYLKIKSLTDYNKINYKNNPISIETDMIYSYDIYLTENSLNQALETKEYKETLAKINNIAYPLAIINNVNVNIKNNKLVILVDYNFPIAPSKKNKYFKITTGLKVERSKINPYDISIDNLNGFLPSEKIVNFINIIDPLTFTLKLMNTKNCNSRIENVKIIDNIIQINGKIYVRGIKNNS